MLFAVNAVGASLERLRRVRRAVSFDLTSLTRALGLRPRRARLQRMRELVDEQGESWEKEVLEAALESKSEVERLARVDELLGDASAALDWGARIPVGAARLSALGTLAVLFFGLAGGRVALVYILPQLAWGGVGVVGALAAGREADRVASEIRKAIDGWVERVLEAARAPAPLVDPRPNYV
jgi:hypothetical protein